jgi:low molecular weight protein-tyrosine phosphatase
MVRLCFVCLGNICRSPTAEGVMRRLVDDQALGASISVESAGTGDWHVGSLPDRRAVAAARARGYRLASRAQQFVTPFFERFDYVIAMDGSNRANLLTLAADERARAKVALLRDFDPTSPSDADVPDPYYGGAAGFEEVLDICERACRGLLDHVRRTAGL